MQVQAIKNQQNFNGNVIVSDLSKKQQKVYKEIQPIVTEMFKDKNYNLFITGNAKPDLNCIHIDSRVTPRFVNFHTLPDSPKIIEPSVGSFSGSFDSEVWLMHVRNLIQRHESSKYYKPYNQISLGQKITNFIKNIFS